MLVWPTSDEMRKHLKHPHRQVGFRDEGPIDWPDDAFTHRRIMDGDITTKEPSVLDVVAVTPIEELNPAAEPELVAELPKVSTAEEIVEHLPSGKKPKSK